MKVTVDREECISCGSCYAECAEVFEENPDDLFTQIVEEYRAGGPGEGEVPDDLEDCVMDAADVCPVEVIQYEE
ncbi:MAG: ferredoxin [Anaerolineae bacterium]|jgi:ferredoxin